MNRNTDAQNLHLTANDGKPMLPAVPSSEVYLEDCTKALKRFNDNYFDLAIVAWYSNNTYKPFNYFYKSGKIAPPILCDYCDHNPARWRSDIFAFVCNTCYRQ